jgi:hypothetical protein
MQERGHGISAWRFAAAMGVSLAVSPLWLAVNPEFWLSLGYGHGVGAAVMGTLVGAILVGAVFVVVTWTREKAPSSLFALAAPLVGVVGYAIAESLAESVSRFVATCESDLYLGLIWAYLLGVWATVPVAAAHTFLMIWVVKPRAPKAVTPPPFAVPPVGNSHA